MNDSTKKNICVTMSKDDKKNKKKMTKIPGQEIITKENKNTLYTKNP